ncbi:MAG: hypothetical protein FWG45_01145 [Oscillospiraceae bacterium]|nr:hypothetical protein [Oscillospiraceae bacterium]
MSNQSMSGRTSVADTFKDFLLQADIDNGLKLPMFKDKYVTRFDDNGNAYAVKERVEIIPQEDENEDETDPVDNILKAFKERESDDNDNTTLEYYTDLASGGVAKIQFNSYEKSYLKVNTRFIVD